MSLLSQYLPGFPNTLVYMLQSSEYQPRVYLAWYWRTTDFRKVAHRRQLDRTKAARVMLAILQVGIMVQLLGSAVFLVLSLNGSLSYLIIGAVAFLSYPIVWAHLIIVPLVLGEWLVVRPRQRRQIAQAKGVFANVKATKIAVAGSYGKTSMKELLLTVLSEGKKVAATPANKNVASSHAEFALSLSGDEEIVIIEYGEGQPGDVIRFCEYTQPNVGIITGLAPAHLDQYKTLEAAGQDIFSLAEYLNHQNVYVNADSEAARPFIKPTHQQYSIESALGWQVSDVSVDFTGTSFTIKKDGRSLRLTSGLLGKHQVGPLALAAALADKLGLNSEQIKAGVAKTAPFEHRMQPLIINGAQIINDGYNGNIDGIRAGLQLIHDLPAKRKVYVTPGLVDQGAEAPNIHQQIGRLIAAANPDGVVLMRNSVEPYIQQGLKEAGYKGKVSVENDPLAFYTNLDQFVAAGDLVMLQNDWTDNYQ